MDKKERLDKVKRVYSEIDLEGIIDCEDLFLLDLKVDLVLSNFVLNIIEEIEEKRAYLDNSYFKLRERGYLLVEVRRRRDITPKSCKKAFDKGELNNLVLARGFDLVDNYYSKYSLVGVIY